MSIEVGDIYYKDFDHNKKIIIIEDYGDEILALVKDYSLVYYKIYHDEDEIFKNYFFARNDEKLVNNLIKCVSETLKDI